MHREKPFIAQLLPGVTVSAHGVYLIRRTDAASVLGADAWLDFGNGLSFDETLDQVLVKYAYDLTDPRFAKPDQDGNRYIPLDVAVGSWMRWATNGSDEAILVMNNLAIAGLMRLFEITLDDSKASPT